MCHVFYSPFRTVHVRSRTQHGLVDLQRASHCNFVLRVYVHVHLLVRVHTMSCHDRLRVDQKHFWYCGRAAFMIDMEPSKFNSAGTGLEFNSAGTGSDPKMQIRNSVDLVRPSGSTTFREVSHNEFRFLKTRRRNETLSRTFVWPSRKNAA